ncbi:MAG TPA: CapA family protein [Thermomicrobiaceae bacterium]|nr:CapA family protein [Thermomicrobiaceae bacterium]
MNPETNLRLALTGDSIIARDVFAAEDVPTQELVRLIREADVAFTNLEVLPNNFRGYPALESGGSHFGAPATVIDYLTAAGFDLFATATNHALDYSIAGLLAMIEVLEEKGVTFAGVGRNLAEARMPAYLEHPGGTVALLACASTFAKGQIAAEQRPDLTGRPGVNPLRHDTTYEITPAQLANLRQMAEQLGLEQRRLEKIQLGFGFPPDDSDVFPFLDANFREAEQAAIVTKPKAKDAEAIAKWVREARNRADLVILSLHAHEQGAGKEDPAAFIPEFAHQMVEAGADLIVGHGPHLLRGLELYQGKPIFYSLGNFIAQNDLTYKLPADDYEQFRVDPNLTPGEVYRQRSEDGAKGFPADRRYWETLVPLLHFQGGALREITLYPVSLGHGQPTSRRGRPKRAEGEVAREILERFAELSRPYGTRIEIGHDQAGVVLE